MNFSQTESYLYSLGNEVSAMKLGLDAMRTMLTALGDPQNNYIKVQVAGTNGKGSVCAFLDAICNASDIKTGTFTSPHLISITERVRINGTDVSENDFARVATIVRETAEQLNSDGTLDSLPTFFEQVTAIALLAFADAGVEVAILETGLGGRLDATTAANAEIAALTRIDLDHQEYLGETLREIAAEKAAIVHKGSQVIIGEQEPEAMDVLRRQCKEMGVVPIPTDTEADSLSLAFPPGRLSLIGTHQIENARVALGVVSLLRERFSISDDDIDAGLGNARHPGRLEYQGRHLFDGAHNVGGARALAAYLDEFETRPITLVFGAMEDKDVGEMASVLFPFAENVILTQPDNSRAMSVEELAKHIPKGFDAAKVVSAESVGKALRVAESVSAEDGVILATGSLYLVGEIKRILSSEFKL